MTAACARSFTGSLSVLVEASSRGPLARSLQQIQNAFLFQEVAGGGLAPGSGSGNEPFAR